MCLIDEHQAEIDKPRTYTREEMLAFAEMLMLTLVSEYGPAETYPEISSEDLFKIKRVLEMNQKTELGNTKSNNSATNNINKLNKRLKDLKETLYYIALEHKDKEMTKLSYHAGWNRGYVQGRIRQIEDVLEDIFGSHNSI